MSYILINSLIPGIPSPLKQSLEHLFYNVLKILFIHMCKKSAGLVWSNYSNIHKVSKYILSILYLYKFVFIKIFTLSNISKEEKQGSRKY